MVEDADIAAAAAAAAAAAVRLALLFDSNGCD